MIHNNRRWHETKCITMFPSFSYISNSYRRNYSNTKQFQWQGQGIVTLWFQRFNHVFHDQDVTRNDPGSYPTWPPSQTVRRSEGLLLLLGATRENCWPYFRLVRCCNFSRHVLVGVLEHFSLFFYINMYELSQLRNS